MAVANSAEDRRPGPLVHYFCPLVRFWFLFKQAHFLPLVSSAELATAKIGHDSRHLFIFPHFYRPSNIGFKSSPLKALCLKGHGNPKFATTRSFRAQFRLVLVYGRTVHDSHTAPAPERAPAGIWPGFQIVADKYVLRHDKGGRSTVQCGSCVTMLWSPSPSAHRREPPLLG